MTISINRDCIAETLRSIYDYQKKYEASNCCHFGCAEELSHKKEITKNTIPFILYTKDGCPFKADGFTTFHCNCCDEEKFKCVTTFIFRIKKMDADCALLELLTFNNKEPCTDTNDIKSTPCNQVDHQKVKDLIRTNICIKVKPSCFCSISCLPAQLIFPRK